MPGEKDAARWEILIFCRAPFSIFPCYVPPRPHATSFYPVSSPLFCGTQSGVYLIATVSKNLEKELASDPGRQKRKTMRKKDSNMIMRSATEQRYSRILEKKIILQATVLFPLNYPFSNKSPRQHTKLAQRLRTACLSTLLLLHLSVSVHGLACRKGMIGAKVGPLRVDKKDVKNNPQCKRGPCSQP